MDEFRKTIGKNDIKEFIESNQGKASEIVEKIQIIKNNIMRRLMQGFSKEEIKFVNPKSIESTEEEYFNMIKQIDGNIDPNFDYKKIKREIEQMFKPHKFSESYIGDFNEIKDKSILEAPTHKILKRKIQLTNKGYIGNKDKEELEQINKALKILNNRNIQNTKSRKIFIDELEVKEGIDKFNLQCFFEEDKNGNRNYFSINDLLNDLETFGIECGYPKIQIQDKNKGLFKEKFSMVQHFIKLALVKNILEKYKNYQEILMYNFKDYEKQKENLGYKNYSGILAEKIIEWTFRNLSNLDNKYNVKIRKASIGEDQKNKVDLIIELKDKKTGINVKKELQLTLNENHDVLKHKKIQILRQQHKRNTDLDLLELELNGLNRKTTIRKNMDRPIGGIDRLLSIEDKEFLESTYNRIVQSLNRNIEHQKKIINNKITITDK